MIHMNTRETVISRETREITLLELAALVIKQEIIESTIYSKGDIESIREIVDDLALCRAEELIDNNKTYKYTFETEAFTCEICNDSLVVLKHSTLDKAVRYALENIGEIHIVFNGDIAVIGGNSSRDLGDMYKLLSDTMIYKIAV